MATPHAPILPRIGHVRSPTGAWILAVVTLGVYAVVHHYVINRELRDFGVEAQPVASVLALFPGVILVLPALVTLWRTSDRIGVAQETAGLNPSTHGPLSAVAIVSWLFVPYHQHQLNLVWQAEA